MKKYLQLIAALLLFTFQTKAQKGLKKLTQNQFANSYSETLPNYLFAKNSDFTVLILTPERMEDKTIVSSTLTSAEVSTEGISDNSLNVLIKGIHERLSSLGLSPSGYVYLSQEDMMDAGKMRKYYDELGVIKPVYSMNIIITTPLSSINKIEDKEKLNLSQVNASISISPSSPRYGDKPYLLGEFNVKIDEAFDALKKAIQGKPKSYFLERVEKDDKEIEKQLSVVKSQLDDYEKIAADGIIVEGFPPLEELKKNHLLIHIVGITFNDKNVEKFSKKVSALYPFSFKVVNNVTMYSELGRKDYKYVLFLTAKTYVKERQGELSDRLIDHGISQSFASVLRNMETLETYYGTDKNPIGRKLIGFHEKAALSAIKAIVNHYELDD